MPEITFHLKRPVPGKDTAIFLLYSCHDGRLKYYTGEKSNEKKFKNWPASRGLAAQLGRISKAVQDAEEESRITGHPVTKAALKARLDNLLHKKSTVNYFEQMRDLVRQMKAGKILTPGKKKYSEQSIRTFNFTIDLLERFDPAMQLSTISMDTYHRFINYCQAEKFSTNYIGSQIKNWKSLGKALGGKIFNEPDFKKISEEAFDVYLTEEEIAKIAAVKLSGKLDHVRDWFILDCYTGLRVSDLTQLSKQNYSKGYITIANEKTDTKVVIPAHDLVKKIRIKHKGFPPPVTSHEINIYIKTICRSAGIDQDVLHTITKGGKRVDTYLKKYEMISNHTARRSFITNMRKKGVPDTIVMKLAGISSVLTLKKYDKLTADEAAKIAAGLDFFK
jgi:integrase